MNEITLVHRREPFGQEVSCNVVPVQALSELQPKGRGIFVCRINGGPRFVDRADWGKLPRPGDVVEMIECPAGGSQDGPLQTFVQGVFSLVSGGPFAFLAFLAGRVIDFFSPSPDTLPELKKEAQTYSTSLKANEARLYEPIPKMCGRVRHFPPYAAQPYHEFRDDNRQYLHVLLTVTIGRLEVERTQIDDTDITHFEDLLTLRYLEPGEAPQDVLPNVVTAVEVSGQDMLTGQIIGPFSACPPINTVNRISVDIIWPFGCGIQESTGAISDLETIFQIDIAELNQFGSRISAWTMLSRETFTAATRQAQRRTYSYEIDPPRRLQVRVTRMDVKQDDANHINDMIWSALRGHLDQAVELNPNVTHLEIVMRSSQQLSQASQGRICVVGTGLVRELLPDGTFGEEIPSRNPLDWQADLWLSNTWGEGLPEEQVDIATLVQRKSQAALRQDRFDYVFETTMDVDVAADLIAGSYRAKAFKRRGGIRSVWRDELVTVPRTAFTTRNTVPGSMSEVIDLPRERTPDGVIVEYFDSRSWNFGRPIECPCPGVTVAQDPVRVRLQGITGRTHATREGLFMAAKLALRRRVVGFKTEMQGSLPAFGSAVRWQSEHTRWQSGDVVDWDPETRLATLSEPVDWEGGTKVISFITDDGTLTAAVAVTPGPLTNTVTLATSPSFGPVTDIGTRDRTVYLLGTATVDDYIVKIQSIADGGLENGARLYDILAFVDDPRIHLVDNHLLPSPGDIQDPIDVSPSEEGGGTLPVVNLTDHLIIASFADMYFRADGRLALSTNEGVTLIFYENEWLFGAPVESTFAAQFEVRFTIVDNGAVSIGADALDAWLPCGVEYHFRPGGPTSQAAIRVEVRDAATEVIQDSSVVTLGILVEP